MSRDAQIMVLAFGSVQAFRAVADAAGAETSIPVAARVSASRPFDNLLRNVGFELVERMKDLSTK
jgi:hypothetical protein